MRNHTPYIYTRGIKTRPLKTLYAHVYSESIQNHPPQNWKEQNVLQQLNGKTKGGTFIQWNTLHQ